MCHPLARLLGGVGLALSILHASAASAEPSRLVVLPVGRGPALLPTVAVAQALTRQLAQPGQRTVRLAYPAPEFPEPADRKSQERHGNKLLKKAFAAYDLMEYGQVNTLANEALQIFKGLLREVPTESGEGFLTCLHLLAASALLQGESRSAVQFMNDAVIFDPRPPSKRVFSPAVQELYEQVRAEPPAPGTVVLESSPKALVWFNGALQVASGRVALRAGLYLVRFYAPGCTPSQRWVRVQSQQERTIKVSLTADGQPEAELVVRLREEARSPEPGPAIVQAALDLSADEVLLVSSVDDTCVASKCELRLDWLKEGRWHRRQQASFSKQAEVTAAALRGATLPASAPAPFSLTSDGLRACTLDNQCLMDERCRDGRCVRPRMVTRTWWFWTLVGAATAGVVLAIALPLTRPQGPVIEVR